jgi:hypothetical protein
MVNYQLGKIYKIVCLTTGKNYIGSTSEPTLARRLAKHISNYKQYLKGNFNYISSFQILEGNNYEILLIDSFPCNNRDELHSRERHWTNQIECVNMIKNQGIINELGKETYQNLYNKEYRENNKETIRTQKKQYREDNKEKIKAKKSLKSVCQCGSHYTDSHKSRHLRTLNHQDYINSLNSIEPVN